jgi:hypothetical protein
MASFLSAERVFEIPKNDRSDSDEAHLAPVFNPCTSYLEGTFSFLSMRRNLGLARADDNGQPFRGF